tara:strand:+ start:1132 stop:1938 length:807 start_codon:yes stop_codon:yes gene_type:complete
MTQVSSSLSPVQEFYKWYDAFEEERRVTKAKKRRGYFHEENERAIIAYNKEPNSQLRNKVYSQHIHKPFMKLTENIIHTFKFYCFEDPYVDVQAEVVAYLIEKIDKFDPAKGSKAYSYFSIVAKNYLIYNNNENYKKMKQRTGVESIDIKRNITNEIVREDIVEARKDFTDLMVEYWDRNLNVIFTRKKDIRVAAAIAELFRRRENIEIYNKKALYIMIREMADVKTQYITKVVNTMRRIYKDMWEQYQANGRIDMNPSSSRQNSKYF